MKAVDAVAEILKREGVKYVFAYPNDPIIDAVARADPYSIIVRQELMCRMALVTLTAIHAPGFTPRPPSVPWSRPWGSTPGR